VYMKVILNVSERLHLIPVLPRESNFVTLRLVRELVNKLGLSAAEFEEFGIKQDGNKLFWDEKKDTGKEFEFGLAETELIVESLKQADEDKKLMNEQFSAYEKFVGPPKN
jgi:hypothetical protein